jgi:hypothetical protein
MAFLKIISLPVLIVSLTACASMFEPDFDPPPGKSMADFNKDLNDCQWEWSQLTPMSDTPYLIPEPGDDIGPLGFFKANGEMDSSFRTDCLEKKGWRRKEK